MSQIQSSSTSAPSRYDDLTVTEAVVEAVADAEGVSPMDVDPPLTMAIDLDALERIVDSMASRPDRPAGVVEFSYTDYEITVDSHGRVNVTEGRARRRVLAPGHVRSNVPTIAVCTSCGTKLLAFESIGPEPLGRDDCPRCGSVEFEFSE